MSPFGSTEEFNARRDKWNKRHDPEPTDTIESRRRALLKYALDPRVTTLYEWCDTWNKQHSRIDWMSVDHIHPLQQDGEHYFENLRLLLLRNNICEKRSPQEIEEITQRVSKGRALRGLLFVDEPYWHIDYV